jgi:probable rRNA maturation factor
VTDVPVIEAPVIVVTVEFDAWHRAVADVEDLCRRAAAEALSRAPQGEPRGEVGVLLCDDDRATRLNRRYRGVAGPTNVLSFAIGSSGAPGGAVLLGDVAIAFETVAAEAAASRLAIADHLTHLVVHGVLHLVGYDHATAREAEDMEALEVAILGRLGVDDPYAPDPQAEEHASLA